MKATKPDADDRIEDIAVDNVIVGEQQIRTDTRDEDIEELALDIERNGLQQPIKVYKVKAGAYQLIFGSRRLQAHRYLRKTHIRALVTDTPPDNLKAAAMRENIHRLQMTMREECKAVAFLTHDEKKSINEVAAILGKGRNWVQARLLIPNLTPEIGDAVLDKRISITHAEILQSIEDPGTQAQALQHCINERWSTTMLRSALTQLANNAPDAAAVEAGLQEMRTPQAPLQMMIACHACGKARPLNQLITIKVCAHGCEPAGESANGAEQGNANAQQEPMGNNRH